jgi:hypothetical protein
MPRRISITLSEAGCSGADRCGIRKAASATAAATSAATTANVPTDVLKGMAGSIAFSSNAADRAEFQKAPLRRAAIGHDQTT